LHKPRDTITVRLEALNGTIEMPGILEIGLYGIDGEGNILDVVKLARSDGPQLFTGESANVKM